MYSSYTGMNNTSTDILLAEQKLMLVSISCLSS